MSHRSRVRAPQGTSACCQHLACTRDPPPMTTDLQHCSPPVMAVFTACRRCRPWPQTLQPQQTGWGSHCKGGMGDGSGYWASAGCRHPRCIPWHPHLLFQYNYWQARASALIPSCFCSSAPVVSIQLWASAGIRAHSLFFRGIRTCCFHATIGKRGHPRSFPLVSVASALVVSIQLLASAGIRAHSLLFLLIRTCCFHTTIAYSVHPHGIRSRLAFQHHSTTMAFAADRCCSTLPQPSRRPLWAAAFLSR